MEKLGAPTEWMASSSETKPDGDPGDKLVEYDTGKRWLYGYTDWLVDRHGVVHRITETTTFATGITAATFSFYHNGYVNLVGCSFASADKATSIGIAMKDEDDIPIYSQTNFPQNAETAYHPVAKYAPVDGKITVTATLATAVKATVDAIVVVYLD